jgi:NADPH-dependent curcumin reductase CurA
MTVDFARRFVLACRPHGQPVPANFRLEDVAMPKAGDGEMLLRVDYLSLDPYMRGRMNDAKSYAAPTEIGGVMPGESIATVLASNNENFAAGDIVLEHTGWSTHAVSKGIGWNGAPSRKLDPGFLPVTTALGVLGMPGFTAYAGLHVIGQPKSGETLVVAAATGPVGSLVGQLAKKLGLRTVGIAGGSKKCACLKGEFGFDAAVDHRAPDFPERITAACPDGIDIYYENVGGAVWQAVLPLLNKFARVPVSGLVAQYNSASHEATVDHLPPTMRAVLSKSLTVRGFINYDFAREHYSSFLRDVGPGVVDGSIRYREEIVEGLDNAPQAFIGMLNGRNFGKLIVRVAPSVA